MLHLQDIGDDDEEGLNDEAWEEIEKDINDRLLCHINIYIIWQWVN